MKNNESYKFVKLEKLSRGRFKNFIIVILVISIIGVTFINKSKAKYRVTQSIQVVSGDIYYAKFDYKIMKVYLQNKDKTSYVDNGTTIPTSGYKLRPIGNGANDSYCTINNVRAEDVTITYNNGQISINSKRKGAKCYLYFDIQETLADVIKKQVNTVSDGCPAYEEAPSITSIEDKKSLLCKGIDDFGDTYYFRGNPTNNWVKIGNFYWRIIRFNGNGSIRLIYSGNGKAETSGTGTQTKTLAYNRQYDDAQYVKYVYGSTDSTIKADLDSWYTTNLKSTYGSKMDGSVGFCNDADTGSTFEFYQYFKPHDRIYSNRKPTFKCNTPTTNLFTTSGGTKGNQKLTNPIGLITADEASFAGATNNDYYSGYYLYTGQNYWTMSPFFFYTIGSVRVFYVYSNGGLLSDYVNIAYGVRPVINLKADTLFKEGGAGTSTNPYEVVI